MFGLRGTKQPNGDFVSYNLTVHITEDDNLKQPLVLKEYIEVPKGSRIIFPTGSYNADGTPKQDKLQPGHNSVYVAYADLGRAIDAFDSKHYSKLKVTSDGQEISISGAKSNPADRMQVKEAVLHLVRDYGLAPLDAKAIVKKAGAGSILNPVSTSYRLFKSAA